MRDVKRFWASPSKGLKVLCYRSQLQNHRIWWGYGICSKTMGFPCPAACCLSQVIATSSGNSNGQQTVDGNGNWVSTEVAVCTVGPKELPY